MSSSKRYPYDLLDVQNKMEKSAGTLQHLLITSQRSTGKTYSFLLHAFEKFMESGEVEECAYVRRWDSDFDGANGARTVYNTLLCNGNGENMIKKISKGRYDAVEYKAGLYYLGKTNEDNKIDWYRDKVICRGFSMNLSERYKGGSFPNITMIGFDEFLTLGSYLKNEFSAMQSIISTIVRDRSNVHCYYFANNVSFMSYPFWDDWGFADELKRIQQGETKVFTYENGMKVGFVWLDVNSKMEKPSESNIYFGFDTNSSKMITQGDWELPQYPHLPDDIEIKPMDIQFIFFVQYRKEIMQCELCEQDSCRFTFIHKKTTPIKDEVEDIIYTDEIDKSWKYNYCYGFRQKNIPLYTKIRDWLNNNPIYFDTNLTGYFFYTYNDQTKDQTGARN